MTERNVTHATFVIERVYPHAPSRVYRAFADPKEKAKWFGSDDNWTQEIREEDFRVGGRDQLRGKWHDGPVSDFQCVYHDIVPNERIIYTYDMSLDGTRISVSLATIELRPDGKGTRFRLTEYGAYLDGYDDAGKREEGTRILLDRLAASLAA
jgi:uncharacterized protein YndB with AHSA1/START domain